MIDIEIFLNEKVIHRSWGSGIVTDINENTITVFFKNTNKGERTVPFQFPQAFNSGFITFESHKLNTYVKKITESRTCLYCHNSEKSTKIISGLRVCNKCESEHFKKCSICNELTLKESLTDVKLNSDRYYSLPACPTCLKEKFFYCDDCETYFSKDNFDLFLFEGKNLCKTCFSRNTSKCYICGKTFKSSTGDEIYSYHHSFIDLCPECVKSHIFECSNCKELRLTEERAISKKLEKRDNICIFCTLQCSCCNETISKQKAQKFGDRAYCLDCWEKNSKSCAICKNDFIPETVESELCPECIESKSYEKRLLELNLPNLPYKQLRYFQLNHLDRCQLFTELYSFCREDIAFLLGKRKGEPFKLLILDIFGRKVVITYLPKEVIGKVLHSENITMTEFKSQKGRFKIYDILNTWQKTSTTEIVLPVGTMRILNYPLLLRVQTSYDKNYGKEWNGPYDYKEICNYGDTTNFYIIGTID